MKAMADGLTVVASRNAGVPELVEEILVTEGDSAAVTDALREFGEDPSRRLSSGRRNAEIVSSRFSPRNVLLLKSLFETIARSPGRARTADRKSTRLNSSHQIISYAVFCLKKKTKICN